MKKKKACLKKWRIYIIACKDTKLYTGITNNLKRRVRQHNSGNGCRFTKYRAPVTLLYSEEARTRSDALKREAQIKAFPRKKKLGLSNVNVRLKKSLLMDSVLKKVKRTGFAA